MDGELDEERESFVCEQCRRYIPKINQAIHSARCPAASSRPSSFERMIPRQEEAGGEGQADGGCSRSSSDRILIDLTMTTPTSSQEFEMPSSPLDLTGMDTSESCGDGSNGGKRTIDLTENSPFIDDGEASPPRPAAAAAATSNGRGEARRGGGRGEARRRGGGGAGQQNPMGVVSPNREDSQEGWICPYCTFKNGLGDEVCGMCLSSVEEQALGVGGGGGGRSSMPSSSAARVWQCPLCTFENEVRGGFGPLICHACETGRPTRDTIAQWGRDGFVMMDSPIRAGRTGVMGTVGTRGGGMRAFENILNGAMFGAGVSGATSMLRGGSPADHRRRVMQGMLIGGFGGGLLGNQLRELAALDHNIDNMSYEDMLNLFGSGTKEPEKASSETVDALPESTVSDSDLQRMRRDSLGGSKDCVICMDEFCKDDVLKRLTCSHAFHKACIEKWLLAHVNCCPVCRLPCTGGGAGGGGGGGGA